MLKGRILYDVTKASRQRQKSGIVRVSRCLNSEFTSSLGERFIEVVWDERLESLKPLKKDPEFSIKPEDVFLTCELFCEYERKGVDAFLASRVCHTYAIFHDAIPLQHPEFTWPHSVQRHPSYMKMLALFSAVFAVSSHSAILLEEYWEWLGMENSPSVKAIQLGADGIFENSTRPEQENGGRLKLLSLSILEKRKGQDLALEAAKRLWDEGLVFDFHFVGRTNPYFGKDLERELKRAVRQGYAVMLHGQINDSKLKALFEETDLVVLPTRAEGCGLPVLEALWRGVPVLASSLHSIRENARFGGCRLFDCGDAEALARCLRALLSDREELSSLTSSIRTDALPRWETTVSDIVDHLVAEGA